MTEDELERAVIDEYAKHYKWKDLKVTQKVPHTFDGTLAVINAVDEGGRRVDEMCFVFENGKVQVFQSTEQLAIFLDTRIKIPWYQRLFATGILSGVVFLLSIILIFASAFVDDFPESVTAVLGAVVGAAAGYYFGSSKRNL